MSHFFSKTGLVLLMCAAPASAQVVYSGGHPTFAGAGNRARPAVVGVAVTRIQPGGWGYGPVGYSSWGYGYGSIGSAYWGYGGFGPSPFSLGGFGGTVIVVPPPVIITPPPVIIVQQAPAGPQEDVGIDPKRFKVIRPDKPADLPMPKKVDKAPVPKAPPERPGDRPNELPLAPPRKAEGRPEAARLVDLGREAFAAGTYALAQERFQDALAAEPKLPIAHFLLAETYFAVGNYTDAAQSLIDGLDLHPEWTATAFRPRELYGDHPARFDEQLKELRAALALQEKDAKLLLVLGTQLWFDGSRDEARRLFEVAAMNGSPVAKLFLDRGP